MRKHRVGIDKSAARHGIPKEAVAGMISAEWMLNRTIADTLQDNWLRVRLMEHDASWWERWAENSSRAAEQARKARLLGNKWPVRLVASGYVMSFGPAQIQPRTILGSCQEYYSEEPLCRLGVKDLMSALLDEASAPPLVAVVLRHEASHWHLQTGQDIRNQIGFLATLYSAGAEYCLAAQTLQDRCPVNGFGRWVEANQEVLQFLISGNKSATSSHHSACPEPAKTGERILGAGSGHPFRNGDEKRPVSI